MTAKAGAFQRLTRTSCPGEPTGPTVPVRTDGPAVLHLRPNNWNNAYKLYFPTNDIVHLTGYSTTIALYNLDLPVATIVFIGHANPR